MISVNNNTIAKVKGFAHLEKGWCYGSGTAPSQSVIDNAVGWLQFFAAQGFLESNAFPDADGDILLSFYIGEANLDLNIHRDGGASLVAELGSSEIYILPRSSNAQVIDGIKLALAIIWNMSVSSTPDILTTGRGDSKVPLSKTHREKGARLSSNSSAALKSLGRSVPILNNSTQMSAAIQRYSGFSTATPYLKQAA